MGLAAPGAFLSFFFKIFTFPFDAGRGFFYLPSLPSLKFLLSSFDALTPAGHSAGRRRWLFCLGTLLIPFTSIKIIIYPLRRARAARGPLLSGQQKVGKDWPKRAAPPLGFPPAVALECLRHNRARGVTELLAAYAAGASARFAKALPASLIGRGPMRIRA